MTVDLDFTNMSDDQFESHLNGNTQAEMEGHAERNEVSALEEELDRKKLERQGVNTSSGSFGGQATLQETILGLSEEDQYELTRIANTAEDGSRALTQFNDAHDLADALSPKYRSEFNPTQEKRVLNALTKMKGVEQRPSNRKSAMNLNDDDFEKVLKSKSRSDSRRSRGDGMSPLERQIEGNRRRQNADFLSSSLSDAFDR
ncbi:hypothetical protein [Vibrio campbellii]|uniref:hypothetical protein n=1 Tax=Vibrio campbellii TaxID=680 RepID=UPI00249CB4E1|nr:hypothetical protein [Vibrio campbellii]